MRDKQPRREGQRRSEGAHWEHRRPAGVNRFDDLLGVDALEVDGGHAEVAVPELALDDVQRHALAQQLERVRVPQLVRRKAATHAGSST